MAPDQGRFIPSRLKVVAPITARPQRFAGITSADQSESFLWDAGLFSKVR
jgi:hypothetical protein